VAYKTAFGLTNLGLPLFPHTLQFTITHALGFSAFYSYPGNGFITVSLTLQITHEVFFSQSSSFLVIILQLPIPKTRLNSIQFLCSQAHYGWLAPQNSALHFSAAVYTALCCRTLLYNQFAGTTQKMQPLS
jgi:hypothetical protein